MCWTVHVYDKLMHACIIVITNVILSILSILSLQADAQKRTRYSPEAILAQAMCQPASKSVRELVYAIRRPCSFRRTSCTQMCKHSRTRKQDPALKTGTMRCATAFQISYNPSANGKFPVGKLMFKSRQSLCGTKRGCGPNICCCVNSK